MDKKLIYVIPMTPFVNFSNKFFVDEALKDGFECEYWDVSDLVYYNLDMKVVDVECFYKKLNSYSEFVSELRKLDKNKTVFVPQITPELRTLPVFLILALFNSKTVFFGRGYLPSMPEDAVKLRLRIIKALKLLFVKGGIKHVFSVSLFSLVRKFDLVPKFDVSFVSGHYAERMHRNDSEKIVHINHFDVDTASANATFSSKYKYFVFLDEYLPYHPDWAVSSETKINDARYYESLCDFFDYVEETCKVKVLIAAHPKSSYNSSKFGGREIYYHKTNEMVKNSDAVLTHASTAVSFAVIYRKPIYLLTSDEIEERHPSLAKVMKSTSSLLGCQIINFDNMFPEIQVNDVNSELYSDYYKEYLSANLCYESSGNTVIKALNALIA